MELSGYEGNITKMYFWQYFGATSTYISPIVGVLYLLLPNTTAFQLGLFTTIAFIFGLLLETISGYISDNVGHKNMLLFFSGSMILSNIFFIIPFLYNSFQFLFFTIGSIFLAIGLSLKSGSNSAFLYETLEELGRESEFKIISAKMSSKVSIFDFITMLLIPLFITISYILPFVICIIFQIIALIICYKFINPTIFERELTSKIDFKKIKKIIFDLKGSFIIPISLFGGIIITAIDSSTRFRAAYSIDIGLSIELVGIVAGSVPLFIFIFGHFIEIIEKYLGLKGVIIINFVNFSLLFFLFAIINNPYLFALLVGIANGFFHSTYSIINHKIMEELPNKKYKATVLSLRSQISMILMVGGPVLLGFLTNDSFKIGFIYFSIIIFIMLIFPFIWSFKYLKNT